MFGKPSDVGQQMQALLDEWGVFLGRAELALALERRSGIVLNDDALGAVETGGELLLALGGALSAESLKQLMTDLGMDLPQGWQGMALDALLLSREEA